jgi:osmoprotectant transport system permease protein
VTGTDVLTDAWRFILEHPDRFGDALWRHVTLSAAALAIAAAIAIPLGIRVAAHARLALVVVNASNIGRTLPSLAILALMMPLLGTGLAPSLFALTLLALPPILINTCTAIRQVDADVIDAARGIGMTRREITRGILIPLAVPVIAAGVRIASVQVISGAVLAAYIGGGGLGDFITAGIAMMQLPLLLVGAVPATMLAIGADLLMGRVQRMLTPRGIA